ncbi:MAG TPA: hypothetical protein VNR62_01975 [Cellulomonas sp.]|nr:hypothetical protein [Cellulomonas sp.]
MSTSVPATSDDAQRRLARRVTYGTVAVLLLVALSGLEAWPLTSFRLFSTVRTGSTVGLQLMAVAPDGSRQPVRIPADQVMQTTTHQFARLAHTRPELQREKVRAWLAAADIDPATVAQVELVRTSRSTDAAGTSHVTASTVVVTVTP